MFQTYPGADLIEADLRQADLGKAGCLMDAYSTVTYWAACLYQIRGYLAVLNGPA